MGAFKPPVKNPGDKCYISDHVDIGMGINATSPNKEAARKFVEWVSSPEFAELYGNALPGFIPLAGADQVRGPGGAGVRELARAVRRHPPALPDHQPRHANLWNEMWVVSANVVNGTQTPQDGAASCRRAWPPGTRRSRTSLKPAAGRTPGGAPPARTGDRHVERDREPGARPAPRDFPWHIVVFLAPAVIIYTLVMILPLAETLRLSFFNRTPGGPEFFVGCRTSSSCSSTSAGRAVLERALEQLLLLLIHMLVQNPIGVALAAMLSMANLPGHLLPHRHLHADHAVGGDHRLRLEADPQPDLGRFVATLLGGRPEMALRALAGQGGVRSPRSR